MNFDITPRRFYLTGVWVFLIIGLCNLANFFIFYSLGNFFSHVAGLAGIAFNFVLVGFFSYLLKTQTSSLPPETEEDLETALKEFKKQK
jgi:hypothetical protein